MDRVTDREGTAVRKSTGTPENLILFLVRDTEGSDPRRSSEC